ncbi:MAG: ribonuclease HII [Candidatus Limnocylindrales bacterium]
MPSQQPHLKVEYALWRSGSRLVVGVDEVGTGALCAPVVAAAVLVRPHTRKIAGVRDSKTLSTRQRERLVDQIKARSLAWGIGAASVAEIESLNVRNATHLAMRRALRRLPPYDHVLLDGQKIKGMEEHIGPHTSIVRGDASSYAIACASVIAKVTRDRLLAHLAARYPGYGWEHNAGYATRDHVAGLRQLGLSPHHRRTYRRIRAILEGDQLAFDLESDVESDAGFEEAGYEEAGYEEVDGLMGTVSAG